LDPQSASVSRPAESAASTTIEGADFSPRVYVAVFLAGLLFFALNEDFALSGDAALYADYALNAKFDEVTVHYGYYRLIWLLNTTLGTWFHIPMHEMLVHLNVVCGALALPVALALARIMLRDSRYALLAVGFLGICGRVVMNATTSEIYMAQTLALLVSFLLFARDRVNLAGVVAGLALYMTPLSIFACLFFPVYDWQYRGRVRVAVWARVALIAFAVYLPFLIVHGYEMLWGIRGLLRISSKDQTLPLTLLANFPKYQFKHYTVLSLLALPAVWAWRREKALLVLTAAVFLPHLYVIAKLTGEDNVFILPVDFFFACCLAAGARVLASRKSTRYVTPVLVTAHLAIMIGTGALFSFQNHRGDAQELRTLARTYLEGKDAVLLTDWHLLISLPYFGRPSIRGPVTTDPLYRQILDIDNVAYAVDEGTSLDTSGLGLWANHPEIYVLETWSASGMAKLFRSKETLTRVGEQHSWRARAKELLGLECGKLLYHGTYDLYRCQRGGVPLRSPPR
jgi:hypothetical protein